MKVLQCTQALNVQFCKFKGIYLILQLFEHAGSGYNSSTSFQDW